MRRYFFHVKCGQVTILDQEGVELADREGAEIEAARRAQEIRAKKALKGPPANSEKIIVADENWEPIFEFPL